MDLEQLGYFLYMEQCEKEEKERQQAGGGTDHAKPK